MEGVSTGIRGGGLARVVSHLRDLAGSPQGEPLRLVLALGVFDGVHIGHQAVIRTLVDLGRRLDAMPVAMFFEPHPRAVLGKGACPKRLTGVDDKVRLLTELGIRAVVCCPFDVSLASLTPGEFYAGHLCAEGISACGFCVGDDWRFGCGNAGDGSLLARLSGKPVSIVPAVLDSGEPVSSTRIRGALESGRMEEASRLLGRRYSMHGVVGHGQGKGGSVLSTPTANVRDDAVQLPKFGVYAARGLTQGRRYDGIVYVGDAPTLRGRDVLVELHLFDFSGNLYGADLTVEFISYLRGSVLFADAHALQAQIERDVVAARRILGNCGD